MMNLSKNIFNVDKVTLMPNFPFAKFFKKKKDNFLSNEEKIIKTLNGKKTII